ncbi:MAG: class I SAM-dependent methyltransferase [Bacteroidetes bacterium]|nr:class I SAM-dependent methyltransferase [Bacteroidota bacterium]
MTRIELINTLIKDKKFQTYLEIGVFYGKCFLNIKCKRKFAVDPDFRIPWEVRQDTFIKKLKKYFFNSFDEYFQVTSDQFFEQNMDVLNKQKPQLVFIDGLHTHEQTMKDVNNCLQTLDPNGIIILHDCNPTTEVQASPASSYSEMVSRNIPNWDGVWLGDVWKTIAHYRTREDLICEVINADCGLGIIRFGRNKNPLNLSISNLSAWDYEILEKNRVEILNLVEPENFIL